MFKRIVFLFALLMNYLFCLSAIEIAEPAKWIKPQAILLNESIPASEVSNGYYYMLSDVQINIEKKHFYKHYAYKIVSEAGVQNSSELEFNYDPVYEKFILHNVKVYRGGKCINKTHNTHIKEIQRETGFEEHLYDESMSVLIVLDDIRPGDIIEYDYSIIGNNPIFEGKFYYNFFFNQAYEMLDVNLRILKPLNRKINEKVFNSEIKAQRSTLNKKEEIIYHARHVKGLKIEEKLPFSYNPFYTIELSEYETWSEVEEWAKRVFSVKTTNSKALDDKITEIKEAFPDKKGQLIAALRFVQDQIRYMGFEMGMNSHKPADPNKVITQRYGDCKDKSFLLCKMLEEMGIKAWPTLVNNNDRGGIKENLVSPLIFNHCIIKVELNGNFYWFDPTLSYQRGNIESYYTPNYEVAYVIGGNKNGLEEMPQNNFAKITANETYQIDDFSGKAVLKIKTIYKGANADDMRGDFANVSSKNMSENLLNYYKTYFKEITIKTPPEIEDDSVNNKIVLIEEYLIDKFWSYPDSTNKKKFAAEIYGYLIREKLCAYGATYAERKMPLFLSYPTHVEQNIHVVLPEDWNFEIADDIRHTEFVDFKFTARNIKNVVDMQLEYKSLTNQIPAQKSKQFVTLLDDILTNSSGLRLTYNQAAKETPKSTSINWLMLIVFIMFLGLFIFLAFHVYNKNPKNKLLDENGLEVKPEKIGGWLVLSAIGLIFTPLACIWTIYTSHYFNLNTWNYLTLTTISVYHPLWAPGLVSELLLTTSVLVFSILLIFMLFTYDKRFPKFMIIFLSLKVFTELVSLLFLMGIPTVDDQVLQSARTSLIKMFVAAAIWIPYFVNSTRCKETFIR